LIGPYEPETIQLQSGNVLAVYTDRMTEALNPAGLEFGEENLWIESLRLPAHETTRRVIARVLEWQGHASAA